MKCKKTLLSLFSLCLLAGVLMLRQLTTPGYFSVTINDTFTYTSWAWQFVEALNEGIIYPRWMPLSFWGYGSPSFVLYPPFAFYMTAFFNLFTGSIITAMNLIKFIALSLSAWGMFFFIKEFYSEKIALLTASFSIIFPYVVSNYYLFGGFASVISYMWFSPILLFAHRYFEKGRYRYLIYAGTFYGALVLTHLINAYMFTFLLLAFLVYKVIIAKRPRDIMAIPIIFLVGFLVSSAYILPLIFEKRFFNLTAFIGESGFHYGNFFILPKQTFKYAYDHFWPVYYGTYALYFLIFITLLLFFLYQMRQWHQKTPPKILVMNTFVFWAAFCSVSLTLGLSSFLWETVPFMKYIQFPCRWYNITAFLIIFLSAVSFSAPDTIHKSKKSYLIIMTFLLGCLFLDFKYINAAPYFAEHELIPVQSVDLTREHLPTWVNIQRIEHNKDGQEKIVIIEGDGTAEIIVWQSASRIIELRSKSPLTVRIKSFYFPGWKAYLNNRETEIKIEDGTGAIIVDAPMGHNSLKLVFSDTPIRYYSKIIFILSWISVFLIFILDKFNISIFKIRHSL